MPRLRAGDQWGYADMPYEDGMQLVFDHVDRTLVVSFRDRVTMIGPFESQKAAVRAGEQYCRERGWDDIEHIFSATSSLKVSIEPVISFAGA